MNRSKENVMAIVGHSLKCAEAVHTTPSECKCPCGGTFHGGPHTERARALLVSDPTRAYLRRQVSQARSKTKNTQGSRYSEYATGFVVTYAIDTLISSARQDADALKIAVQAVVEPFVESVVSAGLNTADSAAVKRIVNETHLLCALCASILDLKAHFQQGIKDIADQIAQAVIDEVTSAPSLPVLSGAARAALSAALVKAAGPLSDLLVGPAETQALRILGLLFCPDVSVHPEVEEFCVKPLTGEILTNVMSEWITEDFPRESLLLTGRRVARS